MPCENTSTYMEPSSERKPWANLLRLPRATTNLRDQKIHAKGCVLVFQESLQLGNLLAQHVWRIADASDDAETAGVGDCSCKFWTRGYVHAGEHDGVVDFEEVGGCGSELLWDGVLVFPVLREMSDPDVDLRGDAMLC